MDLFKASSQWKTRPADERFWTVEEMLEACKSYADSAREADHVPFADIRTEADGTDVIIAGKTGTRAKLTHWAFGQISSLVGAPANYLRTLPATLAVQNLNHGLKNRVDEGGKRDAQLLFHQNGGLLLRAMTSDLYTRIWNWEVAKKLLALRDNGWAVPPARPAMEGQAGARPATETDVLKVKMTGLGIQVGDMIAPAGLYASDHDMFAFMVNEENRIDDGSEGGLGRGFFVENSEVGASSFSLTTFLYRYVCGNHIVWDAKDVKEVRLRHIGSADIQSGRILAEFKRYANSSASDLEAKIASAKRAQIAGTKDEVIDRLFGLRISSRKVLDRAYDMADQNSDVDGSPRSPWGFAQGMTRYSQTIPFADQRNEVDRAAGKVLQIAF